MKGFFFDKIFSLNFINSCFYLLFNKRLTSNLPFFSHEQLPKGVFLEERK